MMVSMMDVEHNSTPEVKHCKHCHTSVPEGMRGEFCCHGCEKAYELIRELELGRFYQMVSSEQSIPKANDNVIKDYALFDSEAMQKTMVSTLPGEHSEAHIYLSNITCYACVWVCEQLTSKLDPEARLHVNMATGEASLKLSKKSPPLSAFVKHYESLGFGVSPGEQDNPNTRSDLARIGVAFFCLMNVMMLALPEYLDLSSLDLGMRHFFRILSSVLASISISYCAFPFFRNAWLSLKQKTLHLDLPITIALIMGFTYSFRNMLLGQTHVYFDSITAVVALLLVGRVIQAKALKAIMREQNRYLKASRQFVRLQGEGQKMVKLSEVTRGDKVSFLPGELIPLKSRLLSLKADLDYGLLKGESQTRALKTGDSIEAGAINGSYAIECEALEQGAESFLFALQNASNSLFEQKGQFLGRSEKMAKFFTIFTLTMASLVGLWFLPRDLDEAFRRSAAVLLVACPCIFGFGAPLVFARAFHLGMRRGLVFRSQKALERLARVEDFYFDKTGTLTEDFAELAEWEWNESNLLKMKIDKLCFLKLLSQLEKASLHNASGALARRAKQEIGSSSTEEFQNVRETFGQGIALEWRGHSVRIGRSGYCFLYSENPRPVQASYVSIDGTEVLRYSLDESLKRDATQVIQELDKRQIDVHILSGDSKTRALQIGKQLSIPEEKVRGELKPEEKVSPIKKPNASAMVGNGINDCLASSAASIGIALSNATSSLKSQADLCCERPGLMPILDAIDLSLETRRVLTRCFALALIFNVFALSLAISGIVTPVMAAILMPISSISVFFSSQRFHLHPMRQA